MTRARTATRKRRSRRAKRRRRPRFTRLRLLLAGAAVLVVVVAAVWLQLYVTVTTRFDGRLWQIPSQIYSDALRVGPGTPLTARQVVARLERCGYAVTGTRPPRPGQYRKQEDRIEVYLRAFSTPTDHAEATPVEIRFRGGRVAAVRDDRGRGIGQAVLEPELLATLYGARQEERIPLRLEDVPGGLVDAVLAAEDSRFRRHHGLDLRGILRAALTNARHGRIVQGGSTITQQTVKNLFLGQQRTWLRKIRESLMSLILDGHYSKDRILEVYLNEVYLGQRGAVAVCGVQAAARFYFGRDVADLSLGEWALLAGMIRSPGSYNPFVNPERAVERRDQVLEAMQRLELATAEQVAAASAEALVLGSGSRGFDRAPYAVDYVRRQLVERYPDRVLQGEGLRIYTTLDTELQAGAEESLRSGLERLERDYPAVHRQIEQRRLQGAVLVTNPGSGAILAMVGGRDYSDSQFNRAAQARRQPGSCFKPFVYAAGFERYVADDDRGLTPATLLEDTPLELVANGKTWQPDNYDHRHRGMVTAREALELSLNVPTVRAAQRVGLDHVIDTARRCGISSPLAAIPSLALGTEEVTALELAEAYGTLARRGERVAPFMLRSVTDGDGNVLDVFEPRPQRAIDPQVAYVVSDILRGVVQRGTARSAAALGYHGYAAGKTGTTDDTRDAWFVGYTNELLALVWVGYDDNASTGLTGASGALPIWVELMRRAEAGGAPVAPAPRDVVELMICSESGQRATRRCPHVVEETFLRGTEPRERCRLHEGRFRRWFRRLTGRGDDVI